MRCAKVGGNGALFDGGVRGQREGDIVVARLWGPGEAPVTTCGADCPDGAAHATGAAPYHVVPHAVLHAARAAREKTARLDAAVMDRFRLLQRRAALIQAERSTAEVDAERIEADKRITEALARG